MILALALATIPLAAQEPKPEQTNDTVSTFNALDYSLQRRYIRRGVPFDRKDWKAHTFVNLSIGMQQQHALGDDRFSPGPQVSLGMGRSLSRLSTVRLTAFAGTNRRQTDNETLYNMGIDADHLLNLSSFVGGYDPARFFETSLLTGIGLHSTSLTDERKVAADAHVGFQFKFHPGSFVDFYVEPRFGIATMGLTHSKEAGNWHNYDLLYGVQVGMNYRFKAWNPTKLKRRLADSRWTDDTFVSLGMGGQWQMSDLTSEMGSLKSLGPAVQLSAGKWMSPYIGLRASLFGAADTWHQQVIPPVEAAEDQPAVEGDAFYEATTYMGARLEAMLNVMELFAKDSRTRPFGLNLLAGGEVGCLKKLNHDRPSGAGFTGVTGALQLKYRLFPEVSLFVEPRLSANYYTMRGNETYEGRPIKSHFTDKLMSVSLGVEVNRASEEDRLARSLRRDEWKRSFFVSAGGGLSAPVQLKRYELKRAFSYAASAAVGAYLTPLSGVRLGADFTPFEVDLKGAGLKYNMASGSLDYLLNLTTLMGGFDPDRRCQVHLLAGVVGSMRLKPATDKPASADTPDTPEPDTPDAPGTRTATINGVEVPDNLVKSRFFMGGELGLHITHRVMPRLSVYVEPKVRLYGNELLMQQNVEGMDVMLQLQAGATWQF